MHAKYNIAAVAFLAAAAALAAPCPAELTSLAAKVAQLRGVVGPFAPPCRVITAEALRAELDRKLRRDLPIPPDVYVEALVRTGFVDGDPAEIYRRLLDFYCAQVLGFYEPEADEMVVVGGAAKPEADAAMVWSHELEHAVQEHRFHLPSRLLAMKGDSDRQRAASAIAEGEAMLVMLLVEGDGESAERSLDSTAEAISKQGGQLEAPGVPEFFVRDLVFPYATGLATVLRAYKAGSWRQVDQLLARPPETTAALLHPDRTIRYLPPAGFDLPAVPAGWREVLTDTVGEWGLAFLLGRRLPSDQASAIAAAWDGDRIRLIREESHPEHWALAWQFRCLDEQTRNSLEVALQRNLPALLARLAPPDRLHLVWTGAGRTLSVLAVWPPAPPQPRSPS